LFGGPQKGNKTRDFGIYLHNKSALSTAKFVKRFLEHVIETIVIVVSILSFSAHGVFQANDKNISKEIFFKITC
jgi:hypothetical protein